MARVGPQRHKEKEREADITFRVHMTFTSLSEFSLNCITSSLLSHNFDSLLSLLCRNKHCLILYTELCLPYIPRAGLKSLNLQQLY